MTGRTVAKPSLKVCLSGDKVAHLLIDGSWGTLGIVAVITADLYSSFVGAFLPYVFTFEHSMHFFPS